MDPSGHPSSFSSLLIEDEELAELRKGSPQAYQRVFSRWLTYVLAYRHFGRLLTPQEGEEIVQQAVAEVLKEKDYIEDTAVTAEEVSECFGRALNRVRARYVRKMVRIVDEEPELSTAMPSIPKEDVVAALHLKETARAWRGYIGQAIDSLGSRDRNLLIDLYSLERFGWVKHESRHDSPESRSPGAEKVARHRARKRFREELETILASVENDLGKGGRSPANRHWPGSSQCYDVSVSTVSLQELQRDPEFLLSRLEAGEHLVVVRGGRPVAELRPISASPPGPRPFGLCAGAFTVPDDFDAPLPDEILRGFEGR